MLLRKTGREALLRLAVFRLAPVLAIASRPSRVAKVTCFYPTESARGWCVEEKPANKNPN
ncbi:MAG: hypothetical protein LBU79_06175 [Planctomycetota bacterium]|nr:hypothetical protein [Planctomycetota bacterium]